MASRRRGNGEGSVYQRKDGRWVGEFKSSLGRRRYVYAGTRQKAARKLTAGLKAAEDGLPFALAGRKTVGAYLSDWLVEVRPDLKPRTHERYEQLIRLYAMPTIGQKPLIAVQPAEIRITYTYCRERGLAAATIRQLHAVLRRAFGQAEKDGLIVRNVLRLVAPPRVDQRERRVLSIDEVRRVTEAAKGDRFEAMYVVAAHTGMREGELLGLHWDAVDLDSGVLEVMANLQRTKDGLVLGAPKSRRSRRKVALNPAVVLALRQHRLRQMERQLRLGPAWQDTGLVFPNEVGGPVEAQNFIRRSVHRIVERAAIPRWTFHDLRGAAISIAIDRGVPITVVSEMVGHSRTSVTLDVYGRGLPGAQKNAAEVMYAALGA